MRIAQVEIAQAKDLRGRQRRLTGARRPGQGVAAFEAVGKDLKIPAGATVLFLVGSGDAGHSPSTSSSVSWRLLDASCNQLAADCATGSVSNDPCTGCSGCCDPNG